MKSGRKSEPSAWLAFKLTQKYTKVDVFMHDKSDDGDEEQVDEHRKIASVTWAKRQGYQVATKLVGQEDDTDCNEGYLINDALPELIKAGTTPTLRLLGSDGRELA